MSEHEQTSPPSFGNASDLGRVFDVIPFPIYIVDVDTLALVFVNKAMQRATGSKVGDTCHSAIFLQNSPCLHCKIATLTGEAHGKGEAEVFEHFNDRDDCWYQVHQSLLAWDDGRTVMHAMAIDISGMKAAQNELSEAYALVALKNAELERISITDALTGLYNRRHLDQRLEAEIERTLRYEKPISVMIMDIDHFKHINDDHGHQIGDQVLIKVADTLRREMRMVDIVGRWGGEEFLIICPETTLVGARVLADKLRICIEACTYPADLSVTASFGVAEMQAGETSESVVARADSLLYRAKRDGRNRVEA